MFLLNIMPFCFECHRAEIYVPLLGTNSAPAELATQELAIKSTSHYLTYCNRYLNVLVKVH